MSDKFYKIFCKLLENKYVAGSAKFLVKHWFNTLLIIILFITTIFFRGEILFWIYMISVFLLIRKFIIFCIKKLARWAFKDANFNYPETEGFGNGLMIVVMLLTFLFGLIINTIDLTKQISTLSFALMILNVILTTAIEPVYGMYMIDFHKNDEDDKDYKSDLRSIKVFGIIAMIVIVLYVTFVFSLETNTNRSKSSENVKIDNHPISKKQAEKEGQYMKLDNGKYYKVHVQSN